MKPWIGIAFLAVLLLGACTPAGTASPAARIDGRYSLSFSDGGGCTLQAVREPGSPFDQVRFRLDCARGGPSYNSGCAAAAVAAVNNVAAYSPSSACTIVMVFGADEVQVTQIGLDMDCGFGHGVYATGAYIRNPEQTPAPGLSCNP